MKVSWLLTGVRQDAYAQAHPLEVSVDKDQSERGYYLHPELFGQPNEKQIEWARHPKMMERLKEGRVKQSLRPTASRGPMNRTKARVQVIASRVRTLPATGLGLR